MKRFKLIFNIEEEEQCIEAEHNNKKIWNKMIKMSSYLRER